MKDELGKAIKILSMICSLQKGNTFYLLKGKEETDKYFFIATDDFNLYNSESFRKSKSIIRKIYKDFSLSFCLIPSIEEFLDKQKRLGKKFLSIKKIKK